jgi:hypothetical protein
VVLPAAAEDEQPRAATPGVPTASPQVQPDGRTPEAVVGLLRRLESTPALDRGVDVLQSLVDVTLRSGRAGDRLRGDWLGHALHPLLTDFPLGAWMSASFLDLFGGTDARGPSRRLIGFGLLVAVPTAASGLAEWQTTKGAGARRVGVVHAAVNGTATVLYGSSWVARHRGSHRLAVGLGVGGGLVATLGGYFGGHLSLVRKVGTADAAFGPDGARQA